MKLGVEKRPRYGATCEEATMSEEAGAIASLSLFERRQGALMRRAKLLFLDA
jgi:hypothetical protein